MKLFQKLFSSEPKIVPLTEKIADVENKATDELDAIVLGRGLYGDDIDLRKAVINKASEKALVELINDPQQDADLAGMARTLYATRLDAGSLSEGSLLSAFENIETQLAIATLCEKEDLHLAVLDRLDDESLMESICAESNSAKARQLIAERIESEEALKRLSKVLKSKDKNAYKIIKAKLDINKEAERQQQEHEAQAQKVVNDLETLYHRPVDKEFVSRFDRLVQRWQEYAGIVSQALLEDFDKKRLACESQIENFKEALEQEAERARALEQAKQQQEAILANLFSLAEKIIDSEHFDERLEKDSRRQLTECKASWDETKKVAKPNEKTLKIYTKICEFLENLFAQYKEIGTLIASRNRVFSREDADQDLSQDIKYLRSTMSQLRAFPKLDALESVARIRELLSRIESEKKEEKQSLEKASRIVGGLIRKSSNAVEQGRLKQALGVRHAIDEKLKELNVDVEHFEKRLEALDESIQKLVDWQAYAVVPKKEALVQEMEKLVGIQEDPEALAVKIKKLQDEWKELSQSGKDRSEDLWQKFSEFSEQAYAPCKAHYEELSNIRKQNLEYRQQLVQQLEEFYARYDWEKADWKHVEQIIRGSRKELHSYSPVERVANKSVTESFDAIYDSIHQKLEEEFAKNKASKQVLIDQAEKLTEAKDLDLAIEGVKRLQAQWKTIGRCHYRDNEDLWKSFRQHCDTIFNTRNEKANERRAAQDEIIEQARTLVKNLEALVKLEGDDLLAARNDRDQIQKEFAELEDIPEKVQRAIERDLNKASKAFDDSIAATQKEFSNQAWDTFFDISKTISDYQRTTLEEDIDAAAYKANKEDLEKRIDEVSHWPEGGLNFVRQKLEKQYKKEDIRNDEVLKALRLLCVRTEILSNKETPQEDKGLRMEYQVSILQKGLGANTEGDNPKATLAKEWCSQPPLDDEEKYQALFQRFYECWKRLA